MIHNWQCKRCTHEWQSSCMGEMMWADEDRGRNIRQLWSHLCWDCFEQLESGEIAGLELFDLFAYLYKKFNRYQEGRVLRRYQKDGMWHDVRYSGMCHEYRGNVYGPDHKIIDKGNFDAGYTAEQTELGDIQSEVEEAYLTVILEQRTAKRIELDEFQKRSKGALFSPRPRPEGFVGDPPGKQRFEVLFGLDPATGDIVAPTIQLSKSSQPSNKA